MNRHRWTPPICMAVLGFVVSLILGWYVADFRQVPTVRGFLWVGGLSLTLAVVVVMTLKQLAIALMEEG